MDETKSEQSTTLQIDYGVILPIWPQQTAIMHLVGEDRLRVCTITEITDIDDTKAASAEGK